MLIRQQCSYCFLSKWENQALLIVCSTWAKHNFMCGIEIKECRSQAKLIHFSCEETGKPLLMSNLWLQFHFLPNRENPAIAYLSLLF